MIRHKDNFAEQIILEEKVVTEKEKLQNQLIIAYAKLRGEICWENWETKEGLEKWVKELETNKLILDNKQEEMRKENIELEKQLPKENLWIAPDYDDETIKKENVFTSWIIDYPKQVKKQNANTDPRLAKWIFELLREKFFFWSAVPYLLDPAKLEIFFEKSTNNCSSYWDY